MKVQQLVAKAKQAGELIQGKDIVLLIGETGTGKSTTVQFLAGCKMSVTKVRINSEAYSDHITTTEPFKYPGLEHVISSPLCRSETRYLTPVTIPLKDVLGAYENGDITLCDAPGIGDTAGPEVDLANNVGVIEALKGCKSVKILVISSYTTLGGRGEGIQRLAHILINMIHGVEERLESIVYAFTRYPPNENINALLLNIKLNKVDQDRYLSRDNVFVAVLKDMIQKTENDKAYKIDPIHGDRKPLIRELQRLCGIQYPQQVIRFSMSGETREAIINQIQRDKLNVICSLKHKDSDLVLYYLNNVKIFNELIEHNAIQEAYEVSKKSVNESFVKHCADETDKIKRLVASNVELKQKDLEEDAIPKLLAHIFTVWTIINNDEYNELRGLESSNDYLLMPHVGQVIAIFRILGIGYQEDKKLPIINITYKKKISDDLVNNLVEIGTGEGKSVVIAITACIFALIGADVVCSCYSEVLSERDMNDFVPVFRALGIEERIKYGTFNKLCEQLLNEQCNLREKVRDMILDNKSVLDIAQKEKIVRHKVLLIDEVDVFLSEKFYGGMYTPSLILKDPYIKELLDSLWKNRDIRSLNGVKALPAYEACASRYSNWISLFDEAIKDMLATLRSFKPSTYMRKNDRIVYVEGESVTDNVILGYDTIWAYYHENTNGNISSSSLEDNVGIIVNCGTFSYAEMPYEFSYIAGVSGTLKTLAESEK
ncbi:unnamed protein product, partial [Rotaria sp. Silwood1]